MILHEQANAGRTLIEKLERYASSPGFAFVLLTPDDLGTQKSNNSESLLKNLRSRARQNVIFELRYFIGKLGRDSVCCLYKEDLELPSDMAGIAYIPYRDRVGECYGDIRKELKQAGYRANV